MTLKDLRDYGRNGNPWWGRVYGGLPQRKTKNERCNRCPACKNVPRNGCEKRDPNLCFGCFGHSTCWGMLPCERWNEEEEAGHYEKFSLPAYDSPSTKNRVDFITQKPVYHKVQESRESLGLPNRSGSTNQLNTPGCLQCCPRARGTVSG